MSQGASNSPSVFSRLMSLALRGLPPHICVCFIDDCLYTGRDFPSALHNHELVLGRFRAAGLKLKPSKVRLFALSCKFLGHIVSENEI